MIVGELSGADVGRLANLALLGWVIGFGLLALACAWPSIAAWWRLLGGNVEARWVDVAPHEEDPASSAAFPPVVSDRSVEDVELPAFDEWVRARPVEERRVAACAGRRR